MDFTENDLRLIMSELMKTLTYVHSLGLVHRDIKADNVMLDYASS